MSGDSSRKPSGSSTHSGTHSPPSASGNTQPQRKIPSGPTTNMFGMGGGNGLKALNTGWQVWGSATTPSSKRNASMSSVASVGGEMPPSQVDSNFRSNLGETWSASRSTSGAWDDNAQKKDFSPLESQAMNLRHPRHRQSHAAFSAPRTDDRSSTSKTHPLHLGQESNPSRYSSSAKALGTGAYPGQQPSYPLSTGPGYDSLQVSAPGESDITLAMRGMAVEDDFNALQSRHHGQAPSTAQVSNSNIRGSSSLPQQRYNTYPTTEYGFYSPGPTRDSFFDYSYVGYGTPDPSAYGSSGLPVSANIYSGVPQSLHPNTVDIRQQQPGVYFDYSAGARPPSQFFFPPQAMMYPPPHSPMLSSQLPASNPAVTLAEKKLEMQYNLQQQLASRSLMFSAGVSPHPQAYSAALDYGSQMLNAAAMYGHTPPTVQPFTQNMRGNRRHDNQQELTLPRSPTLDDFRASKGRKWELRDITGFVVEFSGDQHGSRFIQNELTTASSEERQSVFDEIVPENTLQLIQDVFGNYVIQKLFEHGTQAQKTVLANTMEGHVVYLSSNLYGCRVVQKAIESILPDQQVAFVRELEPHILKCVKDSNGNHVIQKVIERVSPERLGFVSTFIGHVFELASHPFGCRVLQRCLQHLPDVQTRPLLDELLHNYTTNLMQDQFGNYVIQFILEHGHAQDKAQVVAQLRGRMLIMARHKFASNVCEKALIFADLEARRLLIEEIMTPSSKPDGVMPIVTMMKDQYANYVLQRALGVAEGEQKDALINIVRPQLLSMRRHSTAYSKHLTSIERELEKLSPSAPTH